MVSLHFLVYIYIYKYIAEDHELKLDRYSPLKNNVNAMVGHVPIGLVAESLGKAANMIGR